MSRTYQLITSSGIFVLIILFPLSLTASTIVLKNGRTLQGKIINQSRTEVQIEVNGKLQTISKAEISEINLKDPKKEESKKKRSYYYPTTRSYKSDYDSTFVARYSMGNHGKICNSSRLGSMEVRAKKMGNYQFFTFCKRGFIR